MFYLIYTSTWTAEMSDQEIQSLRDSAWSRNKELGITGALWFKNGSFVQILEGKQDAVESLYERIAKDDRHECLQVVMTGNSSRRVFDSWYLAVGGVLNNETRFYQDLDELKKSKNIDEPQFRTELRRVSKDAADFFSMYSHLTN